MLSIAVARWEGCLNSSPRRFIAASSACTSSSVTPLGSGFATAGGGGGASSLSTRSQAAAARCCSGVGSLLALLARLGAATGALSPGAGASAGSASSRNPGTGTLACVGAAPTLCSTGLPRTNSRTGAASTACRIVSGAAGPGTPGPACAGSSRRGAGGGVMILGSGALAAITGKDRAGGSCRSG